MHLSPASAVQRVITMPTIAIIIAGIQTKIAPIAFTGCRFTPVTRTAATAGSIPVSSAITGTGVMDIPMRAEPGATEIDAMTVTATIGIATTGIAIGASSAYSFVAQVAAVRREAHGLN